jgi:hypothetical protein
MIVRINPPGYSFPGVGNWMVDQTNVGGDPTAFTIIHGDGRGPIVTEGPQKSYGTVTFGNADDYVQWFRKYTRYGATMYDAVKYYYEAFVAAGCKLPTRYQFAGANAWAIFYSGIYEKTPNPEFNAIKAFNSVPH